MGLLLAHVSIVEDNIIYAVALHMGYNIMTLPVWFANESQQISMVLFASPGTDWGLWSNRNLSGCALSPEYPLDIRQLAEYFPRIKRKGREVNENYLEKTWNDRLWDEGAGLCPVIGMFRMHSGGESVGCRSLF